MLTKSTLDVFINRTILKPISDNSLLEINKERGTQRFVLPPRASLLVPERVSFFTIVKFTVVKDKSN